MLTNKDLKVLSDTVNLLRVVGTHKATSLSNELAKIHNKVVDNKNKLAEKSREYNKNNRRLL